MCGIAGIIGRVDSTNREALWRMSAAMTHRGPDAEGAWESPPDAEGRGVLLAHRRLAILDLSPAGVQPMIDPATGNVVVFNGEIYNYKSLRDRLGARAEGLRSTGDTAVLLRALGVHGRQAVSWLRGMFTFAFWSAERRELLLARDPLGIKPLYLARNPDPTGGWSIAFASEVRALLASGLLGTPRLDPQAAASVIWNGFVVGPGTAVEGVESLWPGELRVLDPAGQQRHAERFWAVPPQLPEGRGDEEGLAAVLEESVRLHLASDVPLAVFLSGGVDSSVVANLAQRSSTTPVHTFTLAFEEEQFNEGHHARQIAEAIGTSHREVMLTEADFVGGLETALESLDQPTFDGLNSYYMSRAIRQAGFTVALVGSGGDELFGGYTSFRDLPVLRRWVDRLRLLPRSALAAAAGLAVGAARRGRGQIPPQTRWAKLPDMVRRGDDLLALYQLAYALFLPGFQERLLADGPLPDGLPAPMRARVAEEAGGRTALAAIGVMEQRLFLGERLLRDNDAASMAASIEQRLPLVDQVVLEYVGGLSDDVRFRPVRRKELLRRVGLRGLSPALFDRPKSGFVLPFDRWLRASLGRRLDDTMRDPAAARAVGLEPQTVAALWQAFQESAPGVHWSRLWAIYILMRWCQRHGVVR